MQSFSERAILTSAFLRRMAFSESISHHCVAGASSLLKRETFSRRGLAWIRIQSGGQGWSRLTKVVRQFSTDWTKCLKRSAILDACCEAENLCRDRIANPLAMVHVFLLQILQLTTFSLERFPTASVQDCLTLRRSASSETGNYVRQSPTMGSF